MLNNIVVVLSGKMVVKNWDNQPAFKTTESGLDIFTFSIPLPSGKDDEGNYTSEFVKVSLMGNRAKWFNDNYSRIDSVMVNGTPSVNVWNDKSGNAKGQLQINTFNVDIVTWKKSENSEQENSNNEPSKPKPSDPFAK